MIVIFFPVAPSFPNKNLQAQEYLMALMGNNFTYLTKISLFRRIRYPLLRAKTTCLKVQDKEPVRSLYLCSQTIWWIIYLVILLCWARDATLRLNKWWRCYHYCGQCNPLPLKTSIKKLIPPEIILSLWQPHRCNYPIATVSIQGYTLLEMKKCMSGKTLEDTGERSIWNFQNCKLYNNSFVVFLILWGCKTWSITLRGK